MQLTTEDMKRHKGGITSWALYGASLCPTCGVSGIVPSASWRHKARRGGIRSYLASLKGKAQIVTRDEVNAIHKLLEKLLAKDLGLDRIIEERQRSPRILEAVLSYIMLPRESKT